METVKVTEAQKWSAEVKFVLRWTVMGHLLFSFFRVGHTEPD